MNISHPFTRILHILGLKVFKWTISCLKNAYFKNVISKFVPDFGLDNPVKGLFMYELKSVCITICLSSYHYLSFIILTLPLSHRLEFSGFFDEFLVACMK